MKEKKDYISSEIEQKWTKIWGENKTFSPDVSEAKNTFYNLMMFPYPSAEGMHVGNMYAFTGADIYGRFKRMQGYTVLEPIGLDGFGIHSENYALKIGKHPMDQSKISEKNFYRQLKAIGNSFDWTRTVETYDPEYYRWTQWLFIQMFKNGLAYRKKSTVNYCPSCKTVLADEQVINSLCERCSSKVEKKALDQWFFKITNYADRLLSNIEKLDWTEKVKIAQRNWIGKSEGARVKFPIVNEKYILEVFTTRPDTLFGVTFMVVSPEHEIVASLLNLKLKTDSSQLKKVKEYINSLKNKTNNNKENQDKDKTGVFSGLYVINPVNNEEIPIWIADYVLMEYGTGAIMAVPAHDQRDFEFAKRYNLPLFQVIKPEQTQESSQQLLEEPYLGDGLVINSGPWDDYYVPAALPRIIKWLEEKGIGKREVSFHLRDWLISRQRYWGPPIPMVFCETCSKDGKSWFTLEEARSMVEDRKSNLDSNVKLQNQSSSLDALQSKMSGWYPVPDADLPVELPRIDDYKPLGTGKSPLAAHEEFYKTTCPGCGGEAVRETDVSDTFLDSAWYFLRYPSTDAQTKLFDIERTKKWLPVNMYIGGAEHSVLHLLYSRFVTMFLHDLGMLDFEEPFSRFFAHGLLIKEGAKMSKSKGNVIIPDEYIEKYGSDTLRCYLMFLGPFSQGGDFYDTGIEGMNRFLKRVWRLFSDKAKIVQADEDQGTLRLLHKTIHKVTQDIEQLSYNTAIARLMEFYNGISTKNAISEATAISFIKLLAPFVPFMAEELYHNLTKVYEKKSIHVLKWPSFDEKLLVEETVTIVVQVNGRVRGTLDLGAEQVSSEKKSEIELKAKILEQVKKYLEGKEIKQVVYVPRKIINFVTN